MKAIREHEAHAKGALNTESLAKSKQVSTSLAWPIWVASSNGPARRVKRFGTVHSLAFFSHLRREIDAVYRRTLTLTLPKQQNRKGIPSRFPKRAGSGGILSRLPSFGVRAYHALGRFLSEHG